MYRMSGPGSFELVSEEPKKRDRVWSSSLITGGIIDNDPDNGVIRLGVSNQQGPDKVYRATIPYSAISLLQLGVVEIREVTVPEFLRGVPLEPRIKYERVDF